MALPAPLEFPWAFHLMELLAADECNVGPLFFIWICKMMTISPSFCIYQLKFFYNEEIYQIFCYSAAQFIRKA